jgi:hypothetical protein
MNKAVMYDVRGIPLRGDRSVASERANARGPDTVTHFSLLLGPRIRVL